VKARLEQLFHLLRARDRLLELRELARRQCPPPLGGSRAGGKSGQ